MDTDQKLDMALDELVAAGQAPSAAPAPVGGEGEVDDRGVKRVFSSVEPVEGMQVEGVQEVRVAKRIYVGNLSWRTSWQGLKDHFRQVGNVVYADVIRDAVDPAKSKGCGIVEFELPEQALAAIQTLNDVELDGRRIFVREDREDRDLGGQGRMPRSGGGGGGGMAGRGPGGRMGGIHKKAKSFAPQMHAPGTLTVGKRVYVANISWDTSWQDLKDHFRQAGNVVYTDIMQDPSTGRSKGCGIVEFEQPTEALQAISQLSNSELHGRLLLVREDREDREIGGVAPNGQQQYHGGHQMPMHHGGGHRHPPQQVAPGGDPNPTANRQIVVQNLPWTITWQELKDTFRQCGSVVRADVMLDDQGRSKGFGTVLFEQPHEATAAINMFNEQDLGGRVVMVRPDRYAQ